MAARDPFTDEADYHPGLDISADRGTPVYATADGTISQASFSGAYGNLVVIDHKFGIETRYGHLSAFLTQRGQTVKRGDLIGLVGSTGRATGPHLHYEVRSTTASAIRCSSYSIRAARTPPTEASGFRLQAPGFRNCTRHAVSR